MIGREIMGSGSLFADVSQTAWQCQSLRQLARCSTDSDYACEIVSLRNTAFCRIPPRLGGLGHRDSDFPARPPARPGLMKLERNDSALMIMIARASAAACMLALSPVRQSAKNGNPYKNKCAKLTRTMPAKL